MKNEKLTIKELKFVEEYVNNGFNGSKAYQVAYETNNLNYAKAQAWKNLRKIKIQDAITQTEKSYRQICRELQLDRKKILLEIRNVIRSDNAKEKLAGINLLCKITGSFAPEKKEVQLEYESSFDIDITKLSKTEILELQNKILTSM